LKISSQLLITCFFLDATPKELHGRVELRDETEIFETLDDLSKVRKKALMLTNNWYIIDTNHSIGDTYNQIELILNKLDKC
jgi:thymidylate kinase